MNRFQIFLRDFPIFLRDFSNFSSGFFDFLRILWGFPPALGNISAACHGFRPSMSLSDRVIGAIVSRGGNVTAKLNVVMLWQRRKNSEETGQPTAIFADNGAKKSNRMFSPHKQWLLPRPRRMHTFSEKNRKSLAKFREKSEKKTLMIEEAPSSLRHPHTLSFNLQLNCLKNSKKNANGRIRSAKKGMAEENSPRIEGFSAGKHLSTAATNLLKWKWKSSFPRLL
jgi:hypothetical protein